MNAYATLATLLMTPKDADAVERAIAEADAIKLNVTYAEAAGFVIGVASHVMSMDAVLKEIVPMRHWQKGRMLLCGYVKPNDSNGIIFARLRDSMMRLFP